MFKIRSHILFLLFPLLLTCIAAEDFDVVVLSGSEAGFSAAIQAARMGKSVALIEPTGHPGGMAVEGIHKDIREKNQHSIGGIAAEFYRNIAKSYGKSDPFSRMDRFITEYEPHVGSEVIEKMLARYPDQITIFRKRRLREGPGGVSKNGTRISAVFLEDGTRIQGRVFVDASIEGHLLHFSGVTTATGRESNAEYGETLNGIRGESKHRQFDRQVDPYIEPGNPESGLIATIQDGPLGSPGAADKHVMGFCYRLVLTKENDNIVIVEKPTDYDPAIYEIYRRYFAAGGTLFTPNPRLPNKKADLGSWHDLSANLYGENVDYPAGGYATQDRIVLYHEDITRGLIWFLQNDPDIPDRQRKEWSGWGLCKDEFTDNGHWPRRLYIRSARRMVSDFVHTGHHLRWPDPLPVKDPVCLAWWPPDFHHARRIVRDGAAYNEGFVFGDGGWSPFGISYRAMTPKREEATNLITPTCPSSSYVAYGSIRIVCTFMMLGQASGTAAAMSLDQEIDVQDLPYRNLRAQLLQDGMILEIPNAVDWGGKKNISHHR